MKLNPQSVYRVIIIGFIIGALAALLTGCHGPKETTTSKQETKIEANQTDEKDLKIQELTKVIMEQARHIQEMQSGSVLFEPETTPCPDSKPTTVEILPGGGIKATGRVKSATVTNNKIQDDYNTLKQSFDSLAVEKQKSDKNVKIQEVVKEKQVIKKVMPWYVFLLILIALAVGIFAGWHLKRKADDIGERWFEEQYQAK